MENVELVRLVSGEEVLAKIENLGEATKFEKPHVIIPTQAKGIALMPWCPYQHSRREIGDSKRKDCVCHCSTR